MTDAYPTGTDSAPTGRASNGQRAGRGDPDRIAALHAQLSEQVAALHAGPQWTAWLAATTRFHDYSFRNVLLITAQRPDATAVAGYHRWQQLSRHVDRGQKGIAILAPVVRRAQPDGPSTAGAARDAADASPAPRGVSDPVTGAVSDPATAGGVRVAGFRVTYVWDVAQTSGTPLPEKPRPVLLTGQAPPGLWEGLTALVTERGYRVERGDCGNANGLIIPATRTVRVRADVDDAHAVKTLAHELGHVLLHAEDTAWSSSPLPCRGTAEVEAESVAFIVAAAHGIDTSAYSFPYLTAWAASVKGSSPEEVIRATGQRVTTAAHATLTHLLPPVPTREAVTAVDPTARVQAGARRTAALRDAVTGPPPLDGGPDGGHAARPAVVIADRRALLAVHEDAARYFTSQAPGSWVPAYLTARALPAAMAAPWAAGYAPAGWTALTQHLRSLGWSDPVLEASGLARRARTGALVDHFRDRLVLPVHDHAGHVVAFIGRAPTGAPPEAPKYLNSPATDLYAKSEVLFGLTQGSSALAVGAVPVLVEGPLDAIAVFTATGGQCVGLAPCGTALSQAHVRLIAAAVDLPARGLVVATDTDGPGQVAAARAYDLLAPLTPRLRAADLPPGTDPADYLLTHGPTRLTGALTVHARPLLDAVVETRLQEWGDRLQWVEGRVGAARGVALLLAPLDETHQERHVARLAARLDLDPATVRNLLPPRPSPVVHAGGQPPAAPVVRRLASGARPPPPSTAVHRSRTR